MDHPYWSLPLILVSGLARSGTTILRKCIAAHPGVDCCDRESNIIHDLCKLARSSIEQKDRQTNLVVKRGKYWSLFRQLILQMHWPADEIKPASNPIAISTYSAMSPVAGLGLGSVFPKHRILLIVRNGIEVVASHSEFKAFKHVPFEELCALWQLNTEMVKFGQKRGKVVLFRHEWFHDEDQTVRGLAEVFSQLALPFDDACAKVPRKRVLHPTRLKQEPAKDYRNLKSRVDRWRYWTDQQRDIFTQKCGAGMHLLGYPLPWQN